MALRKASGAEVLARMRRGDLPRRFDYAKVAFDDGVRVSQRVLRKLIDAELVTPAPPHVGALFDLRPKASAKGN